MSGLIGLGNNLIERVFPGESRPPQAQALNAGQPDFANSLRNANSRSATNTNGNPGSILLPGEGPADALNRLTKEFSGLPEINAFLKSGSSNIEDLQITRTEQGQWMVHSPQGRQLLLPAHSRATEIASQMQILQETPI